MMILLHHHWVDYGVMVLIFCLSHGGHNIRKTSIYFSPVHHLNNKSRGLSLLHITCVWRHRSGEQRESFTSWVFKTNSELVALQAVITSLSVAGYHRSGAGGQWWPKGETSIYVTGSIPRLAGPRTVTELRLRPHHMFYSWGDKNFKHNHS